jgi:hypothetical protein
VAAAWFDAAGVPGWRAASFASVASDPAVSAEAARLVAGTEAEAVFDRSPPRPWTAERVDRVVAIDSELPGAVVWRLAHPWPSREAAEELRVRVAALIGGLDVDRGGAGE